MRLFTIGKAETPKTKKETAKNTYIPKDDFDKLLETVESDLLLDLLEKKATIDFKNGNYDKKDWGE